MNPLIIYHGNCPDGAGSALAAWFHFDDQAEYRPASYDEDPPGPSELDGRDVYLLDYSFPREVILEMNRQCRSLTIIDHHKTAEAALGDLDFAHFDMKHSGAVLSWKYFHPGQPIPELFQYIEDRDLWNFKLPYSREVSAALKALGCTSDFRVLDKEFKEWKRDDEFDGHVIPVGSKRRLIAQGEAILRCEDAMVDAMVRTAETVELLGHQASCVNASVLFSEVPHRLLQLGPHDLAIGFFWDGQRQRYQVSLRSRDGFDCSEVAKRLGGGGHARASGFICDELPWRKT